jgi:hypothetical protein
VEIHGFADAHCTEVKEQTQPIYGDTRDGRVLAQKGTHDCGCGEHSQTILLQNLVEGASVMVSVTMRHNHCQTQYTKMSQKRHEN